MARIKYVIQERRLAYEGAVKLFAQQRERELAKAQKAAAIKGPAQAGAPQTQGRAPVDGAQSAANSAASALFESVPQRA